MTLDGLRAIYRAWTLRVPFDNIRKVTNLVGGMGGDLPGATPNDFFEAWMTTGAGGTCWPTANGLATLLGDLRFDTRRATASVFDMGVDNHGTVIVRLDGQDWLLDTSMPTLTPLPLTTGQIHIEDHPVLRTEVDPEGDSYYIWVMSPPFDGPIPFRTLELSVPEATFHANYERSRGMSIFNERLYVRRSYEDKLVVLASNRRFERTAAGTVATELTASELVEELQRLGYSASIVQAWVNAGGLAKSMEPRDPNGWQPEIARRPPSLTG